MSTHNICFLQGIRKLLTWYPLLSRPMTCAHYFARNWQVSSLNQWKGANDFRKYFMINLHDRMLLDPARIEPIASCLTAFWTRVSKPLRQSVRNGLAQSGWPHIFNNQIPWFFPDFSLIWFDFPWLKTLILSQWPLLLEVIYWFKCCQVTCLYTMLSQYS